MLYAGVSGVRLYDGPDITLFVLVFGAGAFAPGAWVHRGSTCDQVAVVDQLLVPRLG